MKIKQAIKYYTLCALFLSSFACRAQLLYHGDKEFNQLNLYVKYVNESNNVLGLVYEALSNEGKLDILRSNFENSLFHISPLTIQDRQTCEFLNKVINTNSRHHKEGIFDSLSEALIELRHLESDLNEFVFATSNGLEDFKLIPGTALNSKYEAIIGAHHRIIDLLKTETSQSDNCLSCSSVISIYSSLSELLELNTNKDLLQLKQALVKNIENFDYTFLDELKYARELLDQAFSKIKLIIESVNGKGLDSEKRNLILLEHFNTPGGIPELLNEALELYKNQNKEVKFLKLAHMPLILELEN